jgi:hypothetical protein
MRQAVLVITLALAATAATALAQQPIFRSVMPDGRIIYGDKPAPGAKEAEQARLPPSNIASPPRPSEAGASPRQPSRSGASPRQQALDAADAKVQDAQRVLDAAKAALEAGREPQEGERAGITIKKGRSTGSTRASDTYVQRIEDLENAVAAAQKNLDDALARRNTARY